MLRKTIVIISLSLMLPCGSSARQHSANVDSLIECVSVRSKSGDFDAVASGGRRLLELGHERNDRRATLYGLIYTGHALARRVDDSVKYYYGKALDMAAEEGDYRALTSIYNALAIYTSEMEMNYLGGLSYFKKALECAERSPDSHSYPVVLNNMAMAYYLRADQSGLKYSLEVVDIGRERGDSLLIYSGSFVTSYMYYLAGDYPEALGYIETALATGGRYVEYAEAYSLYANILVKVGREHEAVAYYRKSLEHVGEEKSNTLAYLNYGSYLIDKGMPRQAVDVLEKGLDFIDRRNNAFYRYQLYQRLSEAYEAAGQPGKALAYYRDYHHEYDSIFNIERERAINELRVQYEYEKQEKELRDRKLDLLHERHKLNATVFAVAVLAVLLVVLTVAYRRKTMRYRQIVRQQWEILCKERRLDEMSDRLAEESQKYTVSSLSDEKGQRLFQEFEMLMKSEKIYCERDVTIDKIAKRLGTNRSYLSQAINANGGMTFSQLMNSYRIDEARRILSDRNNDIQIKTLAYELGFASSETFSASFRKSIGMLPSKFRVEIRKMYDSDAC